ncbi:unnamed protein product [Choristocarpus tenellus]
MLTIRQIRINNPPDGCFLYSGGEDAMLSSWNSLDMVDSEGQNKRTLRSSWTASDHSLPVTCVHSGKAGGRVYSSSLDRTAKAWEAFSGQLLLSVACPTFLRSIVTDPAETFLFIGCGGGTILQVGSG